MLEGLVKALVEELAIADGFKREDEKGYSFKLNLEQEIKVLKLESGAYLYAKIGQCPLVKREELFILLMKANFLGQGTGGAVIGLDESENFLTLSFHLPYDMNYKIFRDALEDFTNFLDYWKDELIRHKKAAEQGIL